MLKDLTEIKTTNWQLSTEGVGHIAENVDDIKLSLANILFTAKGSLPLDPYFGTNIHLIIDRPSSVAIPEISKEVRTAIARYETRVKIQKIAVYKDMERLFVKITLLFNINIQQKDMIFDIYHYTKNKETELAKAYSDAYSNAYK